MKVLIADDSSLVCERLTSMLGEIKSVSVVGTAGTVKDTIQFTHNLHPDVVILDIKMPDGSGIEALMHLKKEENPPTVIMFTQYPYPQFRHRCKFLGADYFFDKTNEFDKMNDAIIALACKKLEDQESRS